MEHNPVVNTDKEKIPGYYNEVLAKRIRPKVQISDLEMQEQPKEIISQPESQMKKEDQKIDKTAEAVEKSTAYFKGDNLAATVWVGKYALKNSPLASDAPT